MSDDPRSAPVEGSTTHPVRPAADGGVRRVTRIRAVAAALAAGGLASLGVVLIGPPAAATVSAAPLMVVQEGSSVAQPVRRPDITLGAGL